MGGGSWGGDGSYSFSFGGDGAGFGGFDGFDGF